MSKEKKWDFCRRAFNTEKQSLIEHGQLREKIPKSASKQQFKDNETAEDIREKAMERLKETKKRDSDEGRASPKRHRTTGRLFARENSG